MKTATGLVIALLLPLLVMGRQQQAPPQLTPEQVQLLLQQLAKQQAAPAQSATPQAQIQELQERIKALQLQQQIEKLQAEQQALGQKAQPVLTPQTPAKSALPQPKASENCDGALADMHAKTHTGVHVPAWLQKDADKAAAKLSNKTGIDVDSRAPAQALKDAQSKHACPPTAPGAPAAAKGGN